MGDRALNRLRDRRAWRDTLVRLARRLPPVVDRAAALRPGAWPPVSRDRDLRADLERLLAWGRGRPWYQYAAAAAVVLVAFGLAVTGVERAAPRSAQREAARAMAAPVMELRTFVDSRRPLDVATADPRQLRAWFADKVGFAPPETPAAVAGFRLVGGRLAYLHDRRAAAYMYRAVGAADGGRIAALYVMPRSGLRTPETAVAAALAGLDAAILEVDGFTHVRWDEGELLYSLVSDLPDGRLIGMARAIAGTGTAGGPSA